MTTPFMSPDYEQSVEFIYFTFCDVVSVENRLEISHCR